MTGQILACAVLLAVTLVAAAPAAENAPDRAALGESSPAPPSHPSFADRIAEHTRELPPTRWALDLDFPLTFAERLAWDTAFIVTGPARWDAPDWGRFAIFAGATGGAFGADRSIDIESRRRHPRGSSEADFENSAEELGSLPGIAGVVGGSALFGLVADDDLAKSISADAGEAVLVSGLLTEATKEATGRRRPRDGKGPFSFHPFGGDASFPSGHATAAFALASALSEDLDDSLWVAIPAYALASLVAFSRTRADAHFASDVVVGAAIGTMTGRTVVDLERDRLAREKNPGGAPTVSIQPTLSRGFSGVALNVRF